jgi:hypothetical protein
MSDHKYYYVTVINGQRKGFLLGPYNTHEEALQNVDKGRELAEQSDSWACHYAYGTAGSDVEIKTVFGK